MSRLLWEDRAWEDYLCWQSQDRETLKHIHTLIEAIKRNPFEGVGKQEPLKGKLCAYWNRRIDRTNRIVYFEENGILYVISCRGHYEE